MNRFRSILSISLASASLLFTRQLLAAPLDPAVLPADAKWLVHADLDACKSSKVRTLIESKMKPDEKEEFTSKLHEFETAAGVNFETDVHGITVYGRDFEEEDVVAILQAKLDPAKITECLKSGKDADHFKMDKLGTHDLFSWKDDDETVFGVIYNDRVSVIGKSKSSIEQAMTVLDGSAKSLPADSVLNVPQTGGILVIAGADGVGKLATEKHANTPVLKDVQSGWMVLAESGDSLTLKAALATNSAEVATKVKAGIDGIRAIISLAGDEPETKEIAKHLAALKVASTEKSVQLDWSISFDEISNLITKAEAHVDVDKDDDGKATTKSSIKVDVKVKKD